VGDGRRPIQRMVTTAQQITGRLGLLGGNAELPAHRRKDIQDRGSGSGMAITKTLLQLWTKGTHSHGNRLRNGSYGAEDSVGGRSGTLGKKNKG